MGIDPLIRGDRTFDSWGRISEPWSKFDMPGVQERYGLGIEYIHAPRRHQAVLWLYIYSTVAIYIQYGESIYPICWLCRHILG